MLIMDNKQRSLDYYFPMPQQVAQAQTQADPADTSDWADTVRKFGRIRIDPNYPPARDFMQRLPPDLQFVPDDGGAGPSIILRPTKSPPLTS
jgi:hypothetical protein